MVTKKETKPWQSLTAGTFAGAVEAFVTYPTEFVKTRSQFDGNKDGPIAIIRDTWNKHGIKGFYSGCTALVVGNAAKAGVRFLSYDRFKQMLADPNGRVSAPRSLAAGLGAGMMEAVFAVTPSETIKTKLIDDSKLPQPRFRGLIHGTGIIVREEGIRGIYRGLFPVMMRQGANSAVRFTTYSTLKQFVQSAAAGLVTVYTTMPLDVIKTRMQSLKARTMYKNSFDCAYQTFVNDGLLSFWRGATPRLARLMLSGGIVFTVYEKAIVLLGGREVA
ncbi:hypothetical protein OPQ81_009614 [Rhizoctonia solani]|nr:hypothetical protein OPQ81_009614 [Rhizoctonia solani]